MGVHGIGEFEVDKLWWYQRTHSYNYSTGADPSLSPSVIFLLLSTCGLCGSRTSSAALYENCDHQQRRFRPAKADRSHFCRQMLRLIERVVAFSAVSHLLLPSMSIALTNLLQS